MKFNKHKKIDLDSFILKLRWADPQYSSMSKDELKQIFPLDEQSSKEIWEKSLTFIGNESNFSPSEDLLCPFGKAA